MFDQLRVSGFLVRRGDRVSFAHEMFLNAFAAEAEIRRAAGQPESLLAALSSPRHGERKDMLLGAVDDERLLEKVLECLTDGAVVTACLSGVCGDGAQQWAKSHLRNLLRRLKEEAANVRFKITKQGFESVAFETESLSTWREPDQAFLVALPQLLVEGYHLDAVLEIVSLVDLRISIEWTRLYEEARERKIAIRSAQFANSYVIQSDRSPGITQVCSRLYNELFHRTPNDGLIQAIQNKLGRVNAIGVPPR